MKKIPVTAFSSSPKIEVILNRLQRESGKNRSQIIRDLIISTSGRQEKSPKSSSHTPYLYPQSPEYIIKSFFDLISTGSYSLVSQAIISRGERVLITLPKKPGRYLKYSTWEFPYVFPQFPDFSSGLVQKIKRELGLTIKVQDFLMGRLVPDKTTANTQYISLIYHCKIVSGKILMSPSVRDYKWIPSTQAGRYFTTSLGDPLITWLSKSQ